MSRSPWSRSRGIRTATNGPSSRSRAAALPADEVLRDLGTSRHGLSSEDAEARLRRTGENRLPRACGPGLLRQAAGQLVHFFAFMLWAAAALAFAGRMPQLGWAIVAVVVINGGFSFVQEYRAERATRALAALLPTVAAVVRDGRKTSVPVASLVPGDLVLLREGNRISADARVIRSDGLKVDNSTLTGESEPVERDAGTLPAPPEDPTAATNLIFAGTYATSGSGIAVVLATGSSTRLGGIARLTGEVARRATPLRLDLNRAVRVIAAFAVLSGSMFFGISVGLGSPPRDGLLFAVGVIVALVPEGLLPTLTLALAMGATRMARRGALVRHLEAVETLGATTVICADKTGTMTANQMTARVVAVPGLRCRVSGSGYDPAGAILAGEDARPLADGRPLGRPLAAEELRTLEPLLRAAALCGDARIVHSDGRWRCAGDPTEGALIVLAHKGGIERESAERAALRVREFPFESSRRRMSTVHALPTGALEILVKGSPEAVASACTSVGGAPIGPVEHDWIRSEVEALARDGLRVLAFARATAHREVPQRVEDAEHDLEFLGLVGLDDPVRPEVPEALGRCRRAGIRVLMVTGDHPATALSVAQEAGLPEGEIMLGDDLPEDDEALAGALGTVSILARVLPEQKLRIARALQSRGEVVAMTGDGVNDAPALRRTDIGVAMGVAGTDVAREAADLVLLDDNFAHVVEAVEEGRAAFDNIRRFLTYHLTDNVAELAPFVAWALSARRIPLALSVLQILALDIGTDLLPALALGAERAEPGTMARPPRPRHVRLLDRRVLGRAFGFLGPVEAAVSLSMLPLGAALFFGWRPGEALPGSGVALATLSTMVFASIVAMQMANAFECRRTPASAFAIEPPNRLLVAAVATEVAALAAFVYLPALRRALGQHALGPREWIPVLAAPLILLAAEEARKAVVRRRLPR